MTGLTKPRCRPASWSASAMIPAQNGALALVPSSGLTSVTRRAWLLPFLSRGCRMEPEPGDLAVPAEADK
jgi:hypothetical protein